MLRFQQLFQNIKCSVIGMIHVKPLPGTPKSLLSVGDLVEKACDEATIYKKCGVNGVIVENMFDIPYVTGKDLGPEVIAVMTRICTEVKKIVGTMPCGVQILAGNNFSATAVALASGLQFVRAESFVFAQVSDEGFMQACAGPLLRYAKNIGANDILYFTDIKKKHSSHAVTSDISLSQMAKAAEFFSSDGVVLTGLETGDPPKEDDLKSVRKSAKLPIIIGSGVTKENLNCFIDADALIVGSHFKIDGHWSQDLDSNKITEFMNNVHKQR